MPIRHPAVAAIALALAGCGGGPPASKPADPALARETLVVALDAWKGGEPPASLSSRTPPIRVADEDWLAGKALQGYRIGPNDQMVGASLQCPVTLTLKDARGRPVRKDAAYLVGTDPVLTVIRQEGR